MNPAIISLWLTLAGAPGLSRRARLSLLNHFGSIEAVFSADGAALEQALADDEFAHDAEPRALSALLAGPDESKHKRDLDWLNSADHHLVTWNDPDYPVLLRETADPPIVVYVHGDRTILARAQLAIVGSRNPTPLGAQNAFSFARSFAQCGLVVTSGMALGIDAAAHRGALDAGGSTIAVAGTGLDRVYPPTHRDLAQAIAKQGALVSEFPIGTPVRAGNFPVRNRIISGLSLGVLVVEAALRSGSLITARLAADEGREVFALPGSIHSPLARGCHALIRQGAKLVETAEHVIEELGPLVALVRDEKPQPRGPQSVAKLAAFERQLLDCLGYEPAHIDTVIDRSGLTADTVSSILLQLELRGLVLVGPGGYQRAPQVGER